MKLKLIYPLLAMCAVVLLSTGCKKDEEGTLRLVFKGTYGTEPLVMTENHDYANGQRIHFTRSEFFVSDLRLVDGSSVEDLADIELVDLSFDSEAGAQSGVTLTYSGVPAGSYDDLRLGFGVSSDINATKPTDYNSSSPLSQTGRYWTQWTSFIFSKFEGKLDTLVDAVDNPDLGFVYHSGTNNLYLNINLNPVSAIDIANDGTTTITFFLDHRALMGLPNAPIDIQATPQNHDPDDLEYLQAMLDNLTAGALTYAIE